MNVTSAQLIFGTAAGAAFYGAIGGAAGDNANHPIAKGALVAAGVGVVFGALAALAVQAPWHVSGVGSPGLGGDPAGVFS